MKIKILLDRYLDFTITRYIRHNKYSSLILTGSLVFNFLIMFLAQGTIKELAFILFGAPLIYACLVYDMKVGTLIGLLVAGIKVLDVFYFVGGMGILHGGQEFVERIFIPLFYLFFCLLLGSLIVNERDSREQYRRLSEKLSRANEANIQLFTSTIHALAAAIDAKDPCTRGHSERVSGYAIQIARALGLSANQQQNILYAAILHDIGKIGVPSEILTKSGHLTPEEMEIIREHTVGGAAILDSIETLSEVIPIVYYHHEWYNGMGYPEGIAGGKIPIGARIIAVADAYDAMTSDRPYRPGMTKEEALQELRAYKGSQFDPYVVDAFVDV